jgi:hypothetical protein
MGLPPNRGSDHYRRAVRSRTGEQLERGGFRSLAELRSWVFRRMAEKAGWPADLRPRHVDILNALWDRGPMTRRELADAIGMRWLGSRGSLKSSDPEGSYLAHLTRRGLVMRMPRARRMTGQGKGRSCDIYMLSLDIERRSA